MLYESTRQAKATMTSSEAILAGLAKDGGLLLPDHIPQLSAQDIEGFKNLSYRDLAQNILSLYLDDYPKEALDQACGLAYQSFTDPEVTPLRTLSSALSVLELYHGPTYAFKDVALQILPHLLVQAAKINKDDRHYLILVATSGDTGKAAMAGFADVNKTSILVFYPKDGVSQIQKLQMITQTGDNVGVAAVDGNFDDTQTGVKAIFSDSELAQALDKESIRFSSANSINWGRLVPQIVYYFSSYAKLRKTGKIKEGEAINFVVPTGNFGNILAGYLAKEMGLPVHKLICASNENNVLTDFIDSGLYDRKRPFKRTLSPSMDILISSNLERLIYLLSDRDPDLIRGYMDQLKNQGSYQLEAGHLSKLKESFWSSHCSDETTVQEIEKTFQDYDYLVDTHTAVAMNIYRKYQDKTSDNHHTVVVSTASPYKFTNAVAQAVLDEKDRQDLSEMELLERLSKASHTPVPAHLKDLDKKKIRHSRALKKEDMKAFVQDFISKD